MASAFEAALSNLALWLDKTTTPDIKQAILSILETYHLGSAHIASPAMPLIVSQQMTLGQSAFFASLWHPSWVDHQDSFYRQRKRQHSPTVWLIHLLHKIQSIPLTLWDMRNLILHTCQDNANNREQHNEMNLQIDQLFTHKPHPRLMSHCDNVYFHHRSIDQVKNMTLRKKTNWIEGANLILTKYERTNTLQSAHFASYFQWDDEG